CVIKGKGRSGNAIILVDEHGNRAILVDPGVNDTIRYEEINLEAAKEYRMIHLTSFICKNGTDSLESQKRIVKEFEVVSFDPGMPYAWRGLRDMEPILKHTTIFLPNKAEIEMMFREDYLKAVEDCISLGIEIVVVKLGSEGCFVKTKNKEFRMRSLATKVVDTTGAGDAFNAGFIYGFVKGKDVEECARLGNYVAARCIEKFGAREGLPYNV
ncbi:MAG: carbohydrate kinase family protein, partial [Archaeoglobaceae archaeon]